MGGAEAVAGRELPAEADADASGSLPTPAPARTWGSARGGGVRLLCRAFRGREGEYGGESGVRDAHRDHPRRSVLTIFEKRPQWRARAVLLLALRTPFWSQVKRKR